MSNAFWLVAFMFIIMLRKNKDSPYGNFSYRTIDDVINSNKGFIVFLRGFEKDKYTGKQKMQKMKKFKEFSEFHFFHLCEKN